MLWCIGYSSRYRIKDITCCINILFLCTVLRYINSLYSSGLLNMVLLRTCFFYRRNLLDILVCICLEGSSRNQLHNRWIIHLILLRCHHRHLIGYRNLRYFRCRCYFLLLLLNLLQVVLLVLILALVLTLALFLLTLVLPPQILALISLDS